MYKFVKKISDFFDSNIYFIAVRRGFTVIMPLIILGALSYLMISFPVPAVKNFYGSSIGNELYRIFNMAYRCTFGLLSVYVAAGVTYAFIHDNTDNNTTLVFVSVINSIACLIVVLGADNINETLRYLGMNGVLVAIVVSLVSTTLFLIISKKISPKGAADAGRTDSDYITVQKNIVALMLCVAGFLIFDVAFAKLTGKINLIDLCEDTIRDMCKGSVKSPVMGVFVKTVETFSRMAGAGFMESSDSVYSNLLYLRTFNDKVVGMSFIDAMSNIGGCGNILSMTTAVMLFSKKYNNRKILGSIFPAAMFNISEIAVFGIPVIFNPFLMVPFMVSSIVSAAIVYLSVCAGVFSQTVLIGNDLFVTTPPLISGYIASGYDINGVIVQVIIFVTCIFIYRPFIKLSEYAQAKKEEEVIIRMKDIYTEACERGEKLCFIERNDETGRVARNILNKFKSDMEKNNIELFYQSQNGGDGLVYGGEALLRWKYNGEYMFPSLVTEIIKEAGLFKDFCKIVVHNSCVDAALFKEKLGYGIKISININSSLLDDRDFVEYVINEVRCQDVNGFVCLEITEESSMFKYGKISENIRYLAKNNICVAIDDFSMGHTSIKYLQNNKFGYVKLDGSLVKEITINERSRDIIEAITKLGRNLDFRVVAEYVDSEEIKNELINLGCNFLQGYYFSPAVSKNHFIEYVLKCNK